MARVGYPAVPAARTCHGCDLAGGWSGVRDLARAHAGCWHHRGPQATPLHGDHWPTATSPSRGIHDAGDAATHAERLGHVDLVARIGTRYRRLHLDQLAIRNKVDALETLSELRGLYVREG